MHLKAICAIFAMICNRYYCQTAMENHSLQILFVAETISRVVVRSRSQIVCHRQCGENCEHNVDFTLTQIAVLQKHKHYYQHKQKPVVVKHKKPPLTFYHNMRANLSKLQIFRSRIRLII